MWSLIKSKLIAVYLAAGIFVLTLIYGFGRKHESDIRKIEGLTEQVETMKKSEEIEDEVKAFDSDVRDDRLNEWMRDTK